MVEIFGIGMPVSDLVAILLALFVFLFIFVLFMFFDHLQKFRLISGRVEVHEKVLKLLKNKTGLFAPSMPEKMAEATPEIVRKVHDKMATRKIEMPLSVVAGAGKNEHADGTGKPADSGHKKGEMGVWGSGGNEDAGSNSEPAPAGGAEAGTDNAKKKGVLNLEDARKAYEDAKEGIPDIVSSIYPNSLQKAGGRGKEKLGADGKPAKGGGILETLFFWKKTGEKKRKHSGG